MLKWSPGHATDAKLCRLGRVQIGHEDVGCFDFEIGFDRPRESFCQHIHRADASFLQPFRNRASKRSAFIDAAFLASTAGCFVTAFGSHISLSEA